MADEPDNVAADLMRRFLANVSSAEAAMEREGLSWVTPDYVQHTRRKLTPQPDTDAQGSLEITRTLAEVAGAWPSYRVERVLAVRGERLAACRVACAFGDGAEIEYISVFRVDAALERAEVAYSFDPEDADLAIAELDRLHDELIDR